MSCVSCCRCWLLWVGEEVDWGKAEIDWERLRPLAVAGELDWLMKEEIPVVLFS
jgi:hypothetical protein